MRQKRSRRSQDGADLLARHQECGRRWSTQTDRLRARRQIARLADLQRSPPNRLWSCHLTVGLPQCPSILLGIGVGDVVIENDARILYLSLKEQPVLGLNSHPYPQAVQEIKVAGRRTRFLSGPRDDPDTHRRFGANSEVTRRAWQRGTASLVDPEYRRVRYPPRPGSSQSSFVHRPVLGWCSHNRQKK